jgi:hypothetical protein
MTIANHVSAARKAFIDAEKRLRLAIAAAAIDGGPEQISQIARWLQATQQIITDSDTALSKSETLPALDSSRAEPESARKLPSQRIIYPTFFRAGDTLVKVGWSKKTKSEYEHKAPKAALDALVKALTDAGRRGRLFTMDSLIPLIDPSTGASIPDYQAYLGLGWLKNESLVVQHGRQGYTLDAGKSLIESAEERWHNLYSK